jgi:hypothetical protein
MNHREREPDWRENVPLPQELPDRSPGRILPVPTPNPDQQQRDDDDEEERREKRREW